MIKKKKTVEEVFEAASEETDVTEICNAWCFILGPALGAFCQLPLGHEDAEHLVGINIFTEPKAHFTVTWALDG